MAEASFNNFFNKPFGLNVGTHKRTLQQAGETVNNTANGVLEPVLNFLEDNDKVFTGEVAYETNKLIAQSFNIGSKMQAEDKLVNGNKPTFDSKF